VSANTIPTRNAFRTKFFFIVVSQVTPSQSDALELLDYVILVLRENIINLLIMFDGKKQQGACAGMGFALSFSGWP
jgi:hypothetical protein